MWTRLFQVLLLDALAGFPDAFKKRCPYIPQRTFRGNIFCPGSPTHYSCLFDTNKEDFMEYCNKPDFSAPGEYYVFSGSKRNIECENMTYQPYSLYSNESSRCVLEKSLCIQMGQILYKLGSATEDTQCRCDYKKQYAYVVPPSNRCSCTPSEEDCSCYIKQCEFGYILNADYECKPQNQKSETKCKDIENPRIRDEKKMQTGNYSDPMRFSKSGKDVVLKIVLILVVLLSALCLFICKCGERNGSQSEKNITTSYADFRVVAAIDIGSTSSWYASSKTDTFKTDPLDIKIDKSWMVSRSSFFPTKTATCILMKEVDGSFVSLGHEAQEYYADMMLNDEATNYLFFDKFKMALYNKETISKEMLIKDVKGREKKAVDVFSLFIHQLIGLVMNSYKEFEFNDIQWVLTVPSVWSEKAKEFMRHCAEKIGVRRDRLIIALEPDAVSVYFQYLHTSKPTVVPELDRRYIVVDIGGGTVDISAHEKTDDGDLIELCKSTGNDIGGSEVDSQFLALFKQIVGDRVINELLTDDKYMDSYFDILREIEKCKRNILASDNSKLHFRIPFSNLDALCQKYNSKSLSETIASSKYSKDISLKGEHMSFPRSILLSLFTPVGARISNEIRKVLDKDLRINMIILAGGLSKSPLIVKIIEDSFNSMKVVKLPEEYPADLAGVKGAVLYGHRPHFITSRITEYTYGRLMQPEFEREKHDPEKIITINGIDHCKDVFEILVSKNTRVNVNEKIRKEYKGMHISQKEIRIAVFTTKKDHVAYVDDTECKLFCEVLVPLSESADKTRCVTVDFIFGKTEFLVNAFEKKTGLQYHVSVELK